MTLLGTGKRLEVLRSCRRKAVVWPRNRLQHFHGTAAFQEALLQFLQRPGKLLGAAPSSIGVPKSSRRHASSFFSVPQNSWGRPPAPLASRKAPGGGLQLLQSTGKLLEAHLQFLRDRLQGPKNRLQQLRDHLQKLEAHRSCRRKAVVWLGNRHKTVVIHPQDHALASAATRRAVESPHNRHKTVVIHLQNHALASAATKLHATSLLGLR